MPVGDDVTVPKPEPDFHKSRFRSTRKSAYTVLASVMETAQVVEIPLHAPDQPKKTTPEPAVAVRVTTPAKFDCLVVQEESQDIPIGLDEIKPEPSPFFETVRAKGGWNVAVTVLASVIETVHVGVSPLHAPDQPVKPLPISGTAVRVTFPTRSASQVSPQLIPEGVDEIDPDPEPSLTTESL
jgi:hypothetical protein